MTQHGHTVVHTTVQADLRINFRRKMEEGGVEGSMDQPGGPPCSMASISLFVVAIFPDTTPFSS